MTEVYTTPKETMIRKELTDAETEIVAGGSPFEDCFGDIALYRAGVSFENVCFGSDRYFVGSKKIDKELARTLRSESTKLWNSKYASSADMVGYLREWKQVLASDYNIDWNGRLGTYEACVW
ncbi:MAG: hypothetical protein IKB22_04905 [Lentisphaeria bacterium]|nr:hypothetical protein [Lentisphaeria bacterium]